MSFFPAWDGRETICNKDKITHSLVTQDKFHTKYFKKPQFRDKVAVSLLVYNIVQSGAKNLTRLMSHFCRYIWQSLNLDYFSY